ncbi:hypothetical protein D9M73_287190 [compost metagenome]
MQLEANAGISFALLVATKFGVQRIFPVCRTFSMIVPAIDVLSLEIVRALVAHRF